MKETEIKSGFGEGMAYELPDQQRYAAKLREAEIEATRTTRVFTKDEVDAEARGIFESWGV